MADDGGGLIQNCVFSCELYRFQVRSSVSFAVPADHPAVKELLKWHQQELQTQVALDSPSFGPVNL